MIGFKQCVSEWIRRAMARKLLAWALRLLPRSAPERLALAKALPEARAYERYAAYTELMGETPTGFLYWRGERHWMTRLRKTTIKFPARLVVR